MSSLVHRRRANKLQIWLDFLAATHGHPDAQPIMDFFSTLSDRLNYIGQGITQMRDGSKHNNKLHLSLSTEWQPDTHQVIRINQLGHPLVAVSVRGKDEHHITVRRQGSNSRTESFALPQESDAAVNAVIMHLVKPLADKNFSEMFEKLVTLPPIRDHAELKEWDLAHTPAEAETKRGLGMVEHRSFRNS